MTAEEQNTAKEEDDISLELKAAESRFESTYYSVVSQTTPEGRIMIGPHLELFPSKECPQFASPGTRAYEAKDRRITGEQFVLICDRATVPRVTAIGSYKALHSPGIVKLVDAGIVNWVPAPMQQFALVFEKPSGKKILESPEAKPHQIPEEKIVQAVIEPVVRVLAEFRDVEMVHGAINAENMFLTGADGQERVMLGECLSSAASWRQHPLYEPPIRAMAQPAGRGPGTISDDLYALGVCVAMIARGENLLAGKTPQQVIYEKIEHGSSATIIGRERIAGGLTEFLRGVLNDDEGQRWGLDEVIHWMEGRRLAAKPSRVVVKAARPFVFGEHKYWDLRSLSLAFSENMAEAVGEIEGDQFAAWRKRNFESNVLEMRFERILTKEKEMSREKMVSSVCMALDPPAPVRYKGLSVFPAGLGTALAQATAKGEDVQPYGELVSQMLFNNWIAQMLDEIPDGAGLLALFERCRSTLAQRMPGYGIERALYMLNMDTACMSPALKNHYVLTPGSLLLALEDIARRPDRPELPLDRHMIAFISVREPKVLDPFIGYINAQNRGHQIIGIIKSLAGVQRRFSIGPVPTVCSWLGSLMGPVVELLNDRDLRVEVTKRIGLLKEGGHLSALLEIVGDPQMMQADMQRFVTARQEYKMLTIEKARIEELLKRRKDFGRATGRQIAMVFSSFVSIVLVTGYIVLRAMGFM